MSTLFRKTSASRQLAVELRGLIQKGKWATGAQLPTVRALAAEFGVSVKTVHASLQHLVEDELVECRPRQGAYVKAVSEWADHVADAAPRQVAIIRPISPGENPRVDETQQTSEIIHGADLELLKHDLHPVLLSYGLTDPNIVATLLRQIDRLQAQLVGVIVFTTGAIRQELFDQLDDRELTWVTFDRLNHRMLDNFVVADNTQCGEQIGQCLALAGVRRAVVLGQRTQTGYERIAGILKGYWARSQEILDVKFLHLPDWREGPACKATLQYLEKGGELPQAVVGLGDIIAAGAMRALQQKGIRIPEDVGVITTTGLPLAEYSHPPLTAFHASRERIGQAAVQMLTEMLTSGVRRVRGRFISGQMVFRRSFSLAPDLQQEILSSPDTETLELPPLAIDQCAEAASVLPVENR